MSQKLIKPTNKNFDKYAEPVLAQWLIEAALNRDSIPYGEAKLRLEHETGFSSIGRATRLGYCAGMMMHNIYAKFPNAPLLNVLLVLQADGMPSDGAAGFMAKHFGKKLLNRVGIREANPGLWRQYAEAAAEEVYEFRHWPEIYRKIYGRAYQPDKPKTANGNRSEGSEKDGIPRGRGGEGPNHKALRLWVKAHPELLFPRLKKVRAETEVDLSSGDRADVVYYVNDRTIALEVKSKDSSAADLKRGVYQCIKYWAVLQAMDVREEPNVSAVLVTEARLPGYLKALAKRLNVTHKLVSPKRDN